MPIYLILIFKIDIWIDSVWLDPEHAKARIDNLAASFEATRATATAYRICFTIADAPAPQGPQGINQ